MVVIVQRTLPRYRIPFFREFLKDGGLLLHGRVESRRQPKQNAYLDPVPFERKALGCWSASLRLGNTLLYPVFCPGLWKALKDAKPDVIVTEGESNLLNNLIVTRFARKYGIPYVWWGCGTVPGAKRTGLRRILPLGRMIRGASGVACYSTHAKAFYENLGARNCRVVPNAIEGSRVGRTRKRGHRLIVVSVGALEAPKRIDLALEAMRLLPKAEYWVIGDGPERKRLEAIAPPNAVFFGEKHEGLHEILAIADVFVMPGLGGLSLNLALMNGLPVVAGPADGTEKDLGVHVIHDPTPEKLANAILVAWGKEGVLPEGYLLGDQVAAMRALVECASSS